MENVEETMFNHLMQILSLAIIVSNLLSDVINKLNSLTKNINNISGKVNDDNIAHIYVTVAVRNAKQLMKF